MRFDLRYVPADAPSDSSFFGPASVVESSDHKGQRQAEEALSVVRVGAWSRSVAEAEDEGRLLRMPAVRANATLFGLLFINRTDGETNYFQPLGIASDDSYFDISILPERWVADTYLPAGRELLAVDSRGRTMGSFVLGSDPESPAYNSFSLIPIRSALFAGNPVSAKFGMSGYSAPEAMRTQVSSCAGFDVQEVADREIRRWKGDKFAWADTWQLITCEDIDLDGVGPLEWYFALVGWHRDDRRASNSGTPEAPLDGDYWHPSVSIRAIMQANSEKSLFVSIGDHWDVDHKSDDASIELIGILDLNGDGVKEVLFESNQYWSARVVIMKYGTTLEEVISIDSDEGC